MTARYAIVVGRITVPIIDAHDVPHGTHVVDPPARVARGDEIGIFHLGSTAVVFIEPCAKSRWEVAAGTVRFGERLATAMTHENGASTKVLQ